MGLVGPHGASSDGVSRRLLGGRGPSPPSPRHLQGLLCLPCLHLRASPGFRGLKAVTAKAIYTKFEPTYVFYVEHPDNGFKAVCVMKVA